MTPVRLAPTMTDREARRLAPATTFYRSAAGGLFAILPDGRATGRIGDLIMLARYQRESRPPAEDAGREER